MSGIAVRLTDGQVVRVAQATDAMPLAALKGFLVPLTGVSYGEQRLVFAGVEMKDDGKSLGAYGINSGTIVHLMAGGGGAAAAAGGGGAVASLGETQQQHKKNIENQRRLMLGVRCLLYTSPSPRDRG